MAIIEGFEFFPLRFDDRGVLQTPREFEELISRTNSLPATDVIFIAHGFRNDESDATRLYTNFLKTFRANLGRAEFAPMVSRRFVVAGVYWPSKPFREDHDASPRGLRDEASMLANARAELEELKEGDTSAAERQTIDRAIAMLPTLEGNPRAQDEFVALVLSLLDQSPIDETEGLPQIRERAGSDVLARLGDNPRGISDIAGSIAGGLGRFLNLTKWYVMKDRSGTVGANGVADAVRRVRESCPTVRIHVVGHSLGGRLAAACAKSLCAAPKLELDSLMLLEAAFSHYGFSPDNGHHTPGFFRDVVAEHVVKGVFVSTFSAQDTVVGRAYSIMSRLAGDNTREIGDEHDEFGGLGRNGPLKTTEVATMQLNNAGTPYQYKPDVINNLDGSDGLIKDHSDVTNDAITYAFAAAVART
jgi:hypothetical protein